MLPHLNRHFSFNLHTEMLQSFEYQYTVHLQESNPHRPESLDNDLFTSITKLSAPQVQQTVQQILTLLEKERCGC